MNLFSKINSQRRPLLLTTAFFMLLLLVYNYISQYSFIRINLQSNITTPLKVSWSDQDGNFSELRTKKIHVVKHKEFYTFPAKDLDKAKILKIVLAKRKGVVIKLKELAIHKPGRTPIRINSVAEYKTLKVVDDLAPPLVKRHSILFKSTGATPTIELYVPNTETRATLGYNLVRALLCFGLIFLLLRYIRPLTADHQYVLYALLIVATLIVVMATISRPNSHPDEYVHFQAGKYYMDHWLPPKACADEARGSYSVYGVSRLNNTEIAYFLAGKFARLIDAIPVAYYLKLRVFNYFLFFIIIVLAMARSSARILAIPLLLSPQIWYLFSYFNSEAFAIFVCFITAYQLVEPRSSARRLFNTNPRFSLSLIVLLGLLLACLLLVKLNFYFFLVFAGLLVLGWAWQQGLQTQLQRYGKSMTILAALALLVASSWVFSHHASNDFNRNTNIKVCKENTATKLFNPKTPLHLTMPTLYLRDKGQPFSAVFTRGWGHTMLRSSFGYYGYFHLPSSKYYHQMMNLLFAGLSGLVILSILVRGSSEQRFILAATLLVFALLIATLLWKAWTRDFQPQGRYLAPMLPIFGILLYQCRQVINQNILAGFVVALYVLACFSFISVAILDVNKVA